MDFTIFYSWQSDSDTKTNRFFISDALRTAIRRLEHNPDIELEIRVDSDTKNTAGSPAIAEIIFDKIDKCQVFVCDVSIINPESSRRKTPNPNVLLELGYAVHRLGWERIICVFNDVTGNLPDDLPFDLRHRRITRYNFSGKPSDKKVAQAQLEETLQAAIKQILDTNPPIMTMTSGEKTRLERQRDILTLRTFFEQFNTQAFDYFFEEGRDGFIPDEVLVDYEKLRLYLQSSHFHLYDIELKKKVEFFYKALRYSLSFDDQIFSTHDKLTYKFLIQSPIDRIAFEKFVNAIRKTELALKRLLVYVQQTFHEIDIKETNTLAQAAYILDSSKGYVTAKQKRKHAPPANPPR